MPCNYEHGRGATAGLGRVLCISVDDSEIALNSSAMPRLHIAIFASEALLTQRSHTTALLAIFMAQKAATTGSRAAQPATPSGSTAQPAQPGVEFDAWRSKSLVIQPAPAERIKPLDLSSLAFHAEGLHHFVIPSLTWIGGCSHASNLPTVLNSLSVKT